MQDGRQGARAPDEAMVSLYAQPDGHKVNSAPEFYHHNVNRARLVPTPCGLHTSPKSTRSHLQSI